MFLYGLPDIFPPWGDQFMTVSREMLASVINKPTMRRSFCPPLINRVTRSMAACSARFESLDKAYLTAVACT